MKPLFASILLAASLVQPLWSASSGDVVVLTEEGIRNLGIETAVVRESDFEKTVFALGRIAVIPENRSILSSRIPGRVATSHLEIGKHVARGERLLQLESRQPGDPPPSIWLGAPSDGTLIAINTALGAPVEPSDALAEIADLSRVYLLANLPQATAGVLSKDARVRVRFPLLPEREYVGTMLRFASESELSPGSPIGKANTGSGDSDNSADLNTARVIFVLENADNLIRPGMNAECSIVLETRKDVLSVPREAVQGDPASRHVYVIHPETPNAFSRVTVQTGLSSGERIEIIGGLAPGDEVVTRGSYSIGYADSGSGISLKEFLDAAHGHEHNEDGSEMTPEQRAARGSSHDHDHDHDHDHEGDDTTSASGVSIREIFFMGSTGVLAILLVLSSLRRKEPHDPSAELH